MISRAGGKGGAGGAIAPPIFLEIRKKVAFSTPNILHLPPVLQHIHHDFYEQVLSSLLPAK